MTATVPDLQPIELETWLASTETQDAPPCEWNVSDPDAARNPPCSESAEWSMSVRCIRHNSTNLHLLCTRHKDAMARLVKNFRGRCGYVISACEPLR